MTAKNAYTNDPDKQWIAIDTNPSSPHYGRVYAMWTLFVFNPSVIYESHADARPDGTYTDWSAPQVLPTVSGKRWDTYLLPHVAPDGTVWSTTTSNPAGKGFAVADIRLIWSTDGGASWQGSLPVAKDIAVPTYKNTTFREGIVNTFGVGPKKMNGRYPLYVSWEDGPSGLSTVYLTASTDGGNSWATPIQVNDNRGATEALQPNLDVAPNGTVVEAFYDRRLPCPAPGTPEATGAGIAYDPGTSASPGTPYGRANYCVNTAAQFYKPNLTPLGHNVRLSTDTWDPQLSALRPSCICGSSTFIGDYFGVASSGSLTYTTSVSRSTRQAKIRSSTSNRSPHASRPLSSGESRLAGTPAQAHGLTHRRRPCLSCSRGRSHFRWGSRASQRAWPRREATAQRWRGAWDWPRA